MSFESQPLKDYSYHQPTSVPAANVPEPGHLEALKTYRETHAQYDFGEAYVIEIPLKAASSILKYLENALPLHGQHNLQHLRRFAKPDNLPASLRAAHVKGSPRLHFLVCQTSFASLKDLDAILSEYITSEAPSVVARIYSVSIPLQAPVSDDQAREWSLHYWPTVYKRTNPLGPQPAALARAQVEILPHVDQFMSLAHEVAAEGRSKGFGETVGAVIVHNGNPIAVAGDARYATVSTTSSNALQSTIEDNTLAHAVLRGIALVARKRLAGSEETPVDESTVFQDYPLTPIEEYHFQESSLPPNGYLCVDLDIYLTHEPCVMCSMALLHSRFRRVIFQYPMQKTGGLHSNDNGYGIWWRDELNWKMLCWQWTASGGINQSSIDKAAVSKDMHA